MSTIAAIHAGFKQLGIEGDDQRDLYERVTGVRQLTLMKPVQKEAVVAELRKLGFQPIARRPNGKAKLTGKYAGKLQAMWIAGWNLGIIRERDDAALIAFVKRQTGLDAVQFLRHSDDADRAIQAIKAMLARDGGVDWSKSQSMPAWTQTDGYRIVNAQWRMLQRIQGPQGDLWVAVREIVGADATIAVMTSGDWIPVMNHFGKIIRKAGKG